MELLNLSQRFPENMGLFVLEQEQAKAGAGKVSESK